MKLHWEDTKTKTRPPKIPDDIVDLVFRARCPTLPVDHAKDLYQEVIKFLPWIKTESAAAIHTLHGAESGNGWMRPDEEDSIIHLSKRARFIVRLPAEKIEAAHVLENKTLRLGDCDLQLGAAHTRLLSRETTLFARHIAFDSPLEEDDFLETVAAMLLKQNIKVTRIMSGRQHAMSGMDGKLFCRSLMIDDLNFDDSIHLQQHGIGEHKMVGCGIFLPHKSIAAVYEPTQ